MSTRILRIRNDLLVCSSVGCMTTLVTFVPTPRARILLFIDQASVSTLHESCTQNAITPSAFALGKWTPPAVVTQATICLVYGVARIQVVHDAPATTPATLALLCTIMIFPTVFVPAAVPNAVVWRNLDGSVTKCNLFGIVAKPRLVQPTSRLRWWLIQPSARCLSRGTRRPIRRSTRCLTRGTRWPSTRCLSRGSRLEPTTRGPASTRLTPRMLMKRAVPTPGFAPRAVVFPLRYKPFAATLFAH